MNMFRRFLYLCLFFEGLLLIFLWYMNHGRNECITSLETSLNKKLGVETRCGNFNLKCFKRELVLNNLQFKKGDKVSSVGKCFVKFGVPDFVAKTVVINELILDDVNFFISKQQGRYKIFPDALNVKGQEDKWKINVEKIIFKNYSIAFEDNTMNPPIEFILKGPKIIVIADYLSETFTIKGGCVDSLGKQSKVYFESTVGMMDMMKNFSLRVSASNVDLRKLSPYQYTHTHLQITNGRGIFYFSVEDLLGVLKGYSYLKFSNLEYVDYKNSIFYKVMGLSKKSFFQMIEASDDQLELDFLIHGLDTNPSIKLGPFAKALMLKIPGNVLQGSIHIIGKTVNTLFLGIPGRVIRSKRMKKAKDSQLIKVLSKG